jgi:hypothetical protein
LFGDHRNHEVLPVSEVVKRVEKKVNEMYMTYNEIDLLSEDL